MQNIQSNPVHYHIKPIIQIIPNVERVRHTMASRPGAWKPKAHACTPQKVAPQWHADPVRHIMCFRQLPTPARLGTCRVCRQRLELRRDHVRSCAPRPPHPPKRLEGTGRLTGRKILTPHLLAAACSGCNSTWSGGPACWGWQGSHSFWHTGGGPPATSFIALLRHGCRTKSTKQKYQVWLD